MTCLKSVLIGLSVWLALPALALSSARVAPVEVGACIADYLGVGALLRSNSDQETRSTGEAYVTRGLELAVNAERAGVIGPIDEDALAASGNRVMAALQSGEVSSAKMVDRVRACEAAFPNQYVLAIGDASPSPQTCMAHFSVSAMMLAEVDPETSRADMQSASRLSQTAVEAGGLSAEDIAASGEQSRALFAAVGSGEVSLERFAAQVMACENHFPGGQFQ